MASTRKRAPQTPVAVFCRREGITTSKLARRADMATPHVFAVLAGKAEPKQSTIEKLQRAASEILGRTVSVDEMFFGGAKR